MNFSVALDLITVASGSKPNQTAKEKRTLRENKKKLKIKNMHCQYILSKAFSISNEMLTFGSTLELFKAVRFTDV